MNKFEEHNELKELYEKAGLDYEELAHWQGVHPEVMEKYVQYHGWTQSGYKPWYDSEVSPEAQEELSARVREKTRDMFLRRAIKRREFQLMALKLRIELELYERLEDAVRQIGTDVQELNALTRAFVTLRKSPSEGATTTLL